MIFCLYLVMLALIPYNFRSKLSINSLIIKMNYFCPCLNEKVGNQGQIDMISSHLKITIQNTSQNYVCLQKDGDAKMKRMIKDGPASQKQSFESDRALWEGFRASGNEGDELDERSEWTSVFDLTSVAQEPIFLQFHPSVMQNLIEKGLQHEAAAFSALSRRKDILKSAYEFKDNHFTTYFKIQADIKLVEVDCLLPTSNHKIIFSPPVQRRVWHCLFQKSRAKAHQNYQDMICKSTTVGEVLEQILFAPTLRLEIVQNDIIQCRKLWVRMRKYLQQNKIINCRTKAYENAKYYNLSQSIYYNLVNMEELIDSNTRKVMVLELSSPIEGQLWNGTAHRSDAYFWNNIIKDDAFNTFYNKQQRTTFYILFEDFLRHFINVEICLYSKLSYYSSQNLSLFKRGKGDCFQVIVKEQSDYAFQILQLFPEKEWNRGTLMLFSKHPTAYIYECGSISTNQPKTTLFLRLKTGKYVLYAKVDKQNSQIYPKGAKLQLYSPCPASLQSVSSLKYRSIIEQGLLSLAEQNKRQEYQNRTMWMAFERLDQCGYGFVAFGCTIKSKSKFIIKLNEKDFNMCGYKLKKPYKGLGSQEMTIMPGESKIIICRKLNDQSLYFKFPPAMEISKIPI